MVLPPRSPARMRLPGLAGLLSSSDAAGLGTTLWVRCIMVLLVPVTLLSATLWVTARNTMELAAVLWAFVWVVISCPIRNVCIATGFLFSSNVAEALWGVGGHAQLACLCSSLLLTAEQISDVRFEHVKAHEGNPFNELADGLAKRAAGGSVAPIPADVSCLLVCSDSVSWEWLHGLPPETRGAYPPLRDGSFVFHEARSSVVPGSLVKHAVIVVVKDQ